VRARSLSVGHRPDQALAALEAARRPSDREAPPPWFDRLLVAAAATVLTRSGRPEWALRSLADVEHTGAEVDLEVARAHLARGERDRCAEEVAEILRRADMPLGVRVEACLLRAEAALERGDHVVAQEAAERALRTANPQRLVRPILEAPPRVQGLLRHGSGASAGPVDVPGRNDGGTRGAGQYRPTRVPGPPPARPVVVEPLTARESEVLAHLSALLSTEEIAALMFVSVNTVKSHVRGILRKLGAPRRNEAVRRARELQLV
jgi:LuxR family maltose regulon positive regulatory protein